MAESTDIQEGFLCPMCHKDMRSPSNLITHFQDAHSEEQDILKSIKDIYGKAKKKILKLDDKDLENFKNKIFIEQNYHYLETSQPQEPGPIRIHTDFFKATRRERYDHRTTETNKLVIRLDRLLSVHGGSERKHQEQELVAWVDGSIVTRCPSCTASFNITRRQHHCRLCGSIMCSSCSCFLPYERAKEIVTPVKDASAREHRTFKESDSIRICHHCLDTLESRRKVQVEQMIQPMVCQLYSLLQKNKTQIQASVELYEKMYNSLISGESTYNLQDVQNLRSAIAEKAQIIDTLSKKIATLPVDEETPKAAVLQNNVRKASSVYIKDYLLALPAPPTVQELEKVKKDRALRMNNVDRHSQPKMTVTKVAVKTGWSPQVVSSLESSTEEDPLIEQINIVRNYIKQAKEAQRHEEVASLKENLRMLQNSYNQRLKES